LSLKVRDLPLRVVLQEISRLSGVEIVIDPAITETVSLQIEQIPLDEGLKRLISRSGVAGFLFVYERVSSAPHAPAWTTLKKAVVLARARETETTAGAPGVDEGPAVQQRFDETPRLKALAALGTKQDIVASLDELLHQQDPVKKYTALQELTALLTSDDLRTLIELLEKADFQAEDWKATFRSLQDIVAPSEVEDILKVLSNSGAREAAADFFRQLLEDRSPGTGD
jgi:hypothetical protein